MEGVKIISIETSGEDSRESIYYELDGVESTYRAMFIIGVVVFIIGVLI